MRPNVDHIAAIHEAGHAVIAMMSGMDVKHIVVHHIGARQDEAGHIELVDCSGERDADVPRFLIFNLAGAAAERRATGHYSERDRQDLHDAVNLAAFMLDAEPDSPRVTASIQAAQALANAYMHDAVIWAWVQRVADALVTKRRLTGRAIHELRPREAQR